MKKKTAFKVAERRRGMATETGSGATVIRLYSLLTMYFRDKEGDVFGCRPFERRCVGPICRFADLPDRASTVRRRTNRKFVLRKHSPITRLPFCRPVTDFPHQRPIDRRQIRALTFFLPSPDRSESSREQFYTPCSGGRKTDRGSGVFFTPSLTSGNILVVDFYR